MNAQSLSGPTLFCGVWWGSSPRSKRDASMFVVCFCTCLSADFWLTMWMKSTGVAVYKSQCSLSRMILSMRRISAVEKLHPLCITRSLMEPITCVKRRKTKKGINIVSNELCCRSQSILTSSSSLILAARTREVNAMHRRYFGWAWKTPRDSGSGSFVWAGGLSLNAPETPPSCSFGLLPWQRTAGGWGCRLPVRRCLDRTGRAGSSLPAKGSFLGAALKRCLCPEKETTVGQNCCIWSEPACTVYLRRTHLDASVFEDRHLPEAVLPDQGRLQQHDQSAPLHSPWVLHGVQGAGQAGSRAQTPGAGESLRLR